MLEIFFLNLSRLRTLLLCLLAITYGCGDAGNIDIAPRISGTTATVAVSSSPDEPLSPNPVEQPTSTPTVEVVPQNATTLQGAPENSIINEIFPETSQIELFNRASTPIDISGFWLCHTTPGLIYARIPDNTVIEPEGFLIVNWGLDGNNSENEIFTFPAVPIPLNIEHGEFGFYKSFGFAEDNFADSNLLLDYVQWGEADHFRQGVAVGANIWPENAFVPSPPPGQSLAFTGLAGPGTGNTPDAWMHTTPTIGTTNVAP